MSFPNDTDTNPYDLADLRIDLSTDLLSKTDEQRQAMLLVCYYGYTQAEAAEMLGISDRAVRYRLANAAG